MPETPDLTAEPIDLNKCSNEFIIVRAGLGVLNDMDDPTTPQGRLYLRFLSFYLDLAEEQRAMENRAALGAVTA